MAGDDTRSRPPVERPLSGYSDEALLATWKKAARSLRDARVAYAQAYLRAKIQDRSDGTAHQIATEETGSRITEYEADLDIIRAIWYARGRKP